MKILFLEPFFGGSHQDFAQGFVQHSSHKVDLVTLPARFWKWRMRGAALCFIRQVKNLSQYDLIVATDMMDLTDFKALAGRDLPPIALYFHENQLSYPLGPLEKRDFHLGFTNIISALAADRVFFNSEYHLTSFLREAKDLVDRMPDAKPVWIMEAVQKKSQVLYPGCRFSAGPLTVEKRPLDLPLIIWNHRWEYDKNPEAFFAVLKALKHKGVAFYLALLGRDSKTIPPVFERAQDLFQKEILVYGYLDSAREYSSWLARGTVVVSTAIQENFGISIMEAIRHGCFPLLPDRLSYPEIIPGKLQDKILFRSVSDLEQKLENILKDPDHWFSLRQNLSGYAARFSWEALIQDYDTRLEEMTI